MNPPRWPRPLDPRDPFGDLHTVDVNTAVRYHAIRRGPAALPPDAARAAIVGLIDAIAAARTGRGGDVERLAREVGVWGPLRVDPRARPVVDVVPDAATLARITTDHQPGWGGEAPDRFLGPWADVLDATVTARRVALLHTLAAACFLVGHDDAVPVTPHHQWRRMLPKPDPTLRDGVAAVERAPLALWEVVRHDGDGVVLRDATGIHPRGHPTGPVRVDAGAVTDGPMAGLVARVVPTVDGWVAPIAWAVPRVPPPALVRRWILLETLELRLDTKHPSTEDVLRLRSHVLVRRVHEWL